jgi:hypothetical protein
MKKICLLIVALTAIINIQAQTEEGQNTLYQNAAEKLLATDGNLTIGGYGEVHYNQPLNSDIMQNGKLDVHRVVMLFGYSFNNKTQFITEIEYEHVKEVYIEQAFLQHRLNNYINFRGGLLLIPMGIVNEYHEPTTFNGVERPLVDKVISPTTWREIGFGFTGNIFPAALKYQAYLVNGFNGYNGSAKLNGKNGFRSGRQKGAESFMSSPNFAGKIEYYGILGLNVGLSGYFGNTQSTLYNGIDKNSQSTIAMADSSVVGISMIGLDARYTNGGLHLRGQYYLANNSNTTEYNHFTESGGATNDLGSTMTGFYVEAGYNVLRLAQNTSQELIPFIRIEGYNTHQSVDSYLEKNPNYHQSVFTTGLTWKLAPGAVMKVDMQFQKAKDASEYAKTFNAGFGVFF